LNTILKTIALSVSLSLTLPVLAQAASYTIDPSHSFVKFETSHLGVSKLSGRFNKIVGKLMFDPAAGDGSQSVEVSIDTNSLDTNWADRDKHLRSGDFFNVEKFTNATFKSTKFSGDASGGTLTGPLTFLGVSKNIEFPITKIGEGKDPWGGYRVGFEGIYKMTRKDFGMDFNLGPAAELVDVTLQIEAIKDK
jgi:polyisoprenoid-binding protein YceI